MSYTTLYHTFPDFLTVYVNDAVGRVVVCGDKNSLRRNTVHVDTGTRFEVIEVDEAIFSDEVNNSMFLRNLHGDWKIVDCLRQEIDIHVLLGEWWVR